MKRALKYLLVFLSIPPVVYVVLSVLSMIQNIYGAAWIYEFPGYRIYLKERDVGETEIDPRYIDSGSTLKTWWSGGEDVWVAKYVGNFKGWHLLFNSGELCEKIPGPTVETEGHPFGRWVQPAGFLHVLIGKTKILLLYPGDPIDYQQYTGPNSKASELPGDVSVLPVFAYSENRWLQRHLECDFYTVTEMTMLYPDTLADRWYRNFWPEKFPRH